MAGFNPRPRAGGDPAIPLEGIDASMFQSTPPCGGRPQYTRGTLERILVSIHAPVRGATLI